MAVSKKRKRAGVRVSSTFLRMVLVIAACVRCGADAADAVDRRRMWWTSKLQVRAPNLTDARGDNVERIYYGRASNYGRNHATPMTPHEFYTWFRFAREDIPRLVRALRMPPLIISRNGNRCDGEEVFELLSKPALSEDKAFLPYVAQTKDIEV